MESKGKGFGKLILFGEHFVVYGLPGIASGINRHVEVTIEPIEEDTVIIDDPNFFKETVDVKKQPEHIKSQIFKPIIEKYDLNKIKITFSGDSIPGAGMGFSASLAVAMARATSDYLQLNLSDAEINDLAYECEKVSHGTPSGIDNSCATYNKLIWFEKNMSGGKNKLETFFLGKKLFLVLGDTGKKGNTKELVMGVRERKESNPEEYAPVFERAKEIPFEAKKALEEGNLEKIGLLMNENHGLLKKIGVSSPELEELVKTALSEGALGAKLTGAGGGGLMFALVKNEQEQEKIAKAFEEKGFASIKTIIDGD